MRNKTTNETSVSFAMTSTGCFRRARERERGAPWRTQCKADCILRCYDNFALMRLNAPISDGCVAVRRREGRRRVWQRAEGSPYFVQMQMLFGCLRRIVHFNMARWVAKSTRKFCCMQISRLQQQQQQRGK